ncbi:hypothetical protein [Mycobacterium sp. 236(2023)]|uniref:hypothetical protein n=1 Tax=Mycobacterium sp. 236(2023) TaxID=3038163 RepID=UPI0024154CFA|nr:hypothetical protein [Mycobacterium sp. 236(2023)]MDG4666353.1 hypothetical protein [Mycobacterium sp. 236(2023)]
MPIAALKRVERKVNRARTITQCLQGKAWRMSFSRGGYRVERLARVEFVFEAVAQVSDRLSNEPLLVTYPGVGPRPRNSVDHSIFQFDRQRQQDVGGLTARADLRHLQILPALYSGSRAVAKFIDAPVRNHAAYPSTMAEDNSGVESRSTPPRQFSQRIDIVVPADFDEPLPLEEIEAWEAPRGKPQTQVANESLGDG